MSLEAFYETIGGDLAGVRGRLQTDERIERFVRFFLADEAYPQLIAAADAGDLPAEFRAAHTLKGTGRDMGFTRLAEPAAELAEALRPGEDGAPAAPERAPELLAQVTQAYEELTAAAQANL